ncbi:hypothetical protein JCM19235_5483 [Vibrio maritimus]|uniref:Uncharacterized protein n=1 Tax=Vibrio maritimus TaxID=990268 RepID=A0A090RRV1_9VIBR|nr:hypothetical protein JCM19235_5483 [Vibrio maritimus]
MSVEDEAELRKFSDIRRFKALVRKQLSKPYKKRLESTFRAKIESKIRRRSNRRNKSNLPNREPGEEKNNSLNYVEKMQNLTKLQQKVGILTDVIAVSRNVNEEILFSNELDQYYRLKQSTPDAKGWEIDEKAGVAYLDIISFVPETASTSTAVNRDYTKEEWIELTDHYKANLKTLHFRYYRLCAAHNVTRGGAETIIKEVQDLAAKKENSTWKIIAAGFFGFIAAGFMFA